MENHMFRTTINDLLEKNMIDVIGKGRSTRYVFKLSSPEQSYGVVRQIKSTTIRHFILTGIAEKRSNKAYYKHLIRQIK